MIYTLLSIGIAIFVLFCFFISAFQTVHGQILAVNVAHLRKNRQATGNETAGENAFKEIVKSTKVHKSLSLTNLFNKLPSNPTLPTPAHGHLIIHT